MQETNKATYLGVECPRTKDVELVELRLSKSPEFQLHPPEPVSCSQLEDASNCGNCLKTPQAG